MLSALSVGLTKNIAIPINPPFFSRNKVTYRKARIYKNPKEGPEWNNVAYDVKLKKKKSYYFTTNSHPYFNQRERIRTWEIKRKSCKQETKKGKRWKKVKIKQINSIKLNMSNNN